MNNKKEWTTENSANVSAGSYWFCLSETTAPTDYDLSNFRPFKSLVIENKSSQPIDVILDPAPLSSSKSWRVPNNSSINIKTEENITFHNVIVLNSGSVAITTNELKAQLRNY